LKSPGSDGPTGIQSVSVKVGSNKIGKLHCPAPLWEKMKRADAIEIKAPIHARVDYLLKEYHEFTEDPDELKRRLGLLTERHGKNTVNSWFELIDQNNWTAFVTRLLEDHYDPAYQRSIKTNERKIRRSIPLNDLGMDGFEDIIANLKSTNT
jgi:tRNA 2-selenouridine synthase